MLTTVNNKNLAIANRSRVSCINTNNNIMTLKSGLEVTVVTMAVSVAVCDIFNVKEWRDLETGLGFVQGHWKWHQ